MKTILEILRSDSFKSAGLILLGWLLGQAEHWFTEHRERRKALSRALADLLEIRHQLIAMEFVLGEIGKFGQIPPQAASQFRLFSESLLPDWNELHRRFDESVTVVASLDPLLGFQLRSKDFIRPVFQRLHLVIVQGDPQAAMIGQAVTQSLFGEAEAALNDAILKVSRKRGPVTWYRVRRSLRPNEKLQEKVRKLVDILKAAAPEAQTNAPASTQPEPPSQKSAGS
jgi:hypothetical protein